jgi:hypothetical protein
MSNDLVRRLRQGGTYQHDTVPMLKAADRIEQLNALLDEEAFSQTLFDAVVNQRNRANARIEQLETALRELSTDWDCCVVSKNMKDIARKALEGKDD